jgi:glucuronate isomerase
MAFMDDDFLLTNPTAKTLYHEYAAKMPIIDYHCHLIPREISDNRTFRNLTEAWLSGDHYKWRAMRAAGVEERFITGHATDEEKFFAYARTLPQAVGNPLYHWSHLELRRYFGIDDIINEANAPAIWTKANERLSGPGFSARDFIIKSKVRVICTTDDPADSLEYHLKLREERSFPVKVLPSFRPDRALNIEMDGFPQYMRRLGESAGVAIARFDDLLVALEKRIAFFRQAGCVVSDHALDEVPYAEAGEREISDIFRKAMDGGSVSREEAWKYKTRLLIFLGKQYAKHGWAMQYHINAHRNNNSRMLSLLGPDTGYDAMNDTPVAHTLTRLLDALEKEEALPKTILYSLNPTQNHLLAAIMGSFQGGGVPGKLQLGSAWWFNDTKEGMIAQMKALAEIGLLGRFVGMLTDSRSFLSYTRHEYFRRILCNLIGEWVEGGELPADEAWLGGIVQDICFNNANNYFGFGVDA